MSKVYADAITTTEASQDLILGGSGDNVIVTAGATLKTNTVKDSGGNTLWTSDGSGTLSSVNAAIKGNMTLLSTQTASNAASLSFTSGIDSTYKLYIFTFIDVNPATDNTDFNFNGSIDGGSNYNVTKTTSFFDTYHNEGDDPSTGAIRYRADYDLVQSTAFQPIGYNLGNGADESCVGELYLFNPSSTTYVKHFYSKTNYLYASDVTYTT
jgi:hypothetical protein